MRIYNNTNSQIEFDLTPSRKIVIPAHQYSGNFLPNTDTLERLVKVFTPNQIAFLASGIVELNLCANVNSTVIGNFVHTSFDEISEKFNLDGVNLDGAKKEEKKEEKKAEPKVETEEAADKGVLKEKVIEAAPEPEKEPVVEDAPVAEPEATTPKKSSRRKKKE